MGTEFSILTGKLELLLDGCSPGKQFHTSISMSNKTLMKNLKVILHARQVSLNDQIFLIPLVPETAGYCGI